MGRAKVDLSRWDDEISQSYRAGLTQREVLAQLNATHGVSVSLRTLYRHIKELGIDKYERTEDTPAMRERLAHHFHAGLKSDQLLQALQEEGFTVGRRGLERLRMTMGLRLRIRDPSMTEVKDAEARDAVAAAIAEGLDLGRENMYNYIRSRYNIVGRDRVQRATRQLDPEGIARRRRTGAKNRRDYLARRAQMQTPAPVVDPPLDFPQPPIDDPRSHFAQAPADHSPSHYPPHTPDDHSITPFHHSQVDPSLYQGATVDAHTSHDLTNGSGDVIRMHEG